MLDKLKDPNTQAMLMKVVRQIMPALGSALATYGYVTDAKWQVITGIVLNGLSLLWMILNNTPTAIVQQADKLPNVKGVITTPTVEGAELARAVPSLTVASAGTPAAKEIAK